MWVLLLLSIWAFIGGCVVLERDDLLFENPAPIYKKVAYLFCVSGPIGLVLMLTLAVLFMTVSKLFDCMFLLADRLGEWMENSK